jgi:hypothetical protein
LTSLFMLLFMLLFMPYGMLMKPRNVGNAG